jgi:hypothetical protein
VKWCSWRCCMRVNPYTRKQHQTIWMIGIILVDSMAARRTESIDQVDHKKLLVFPVVKEWNAAKMQVHWMTLSSCPSNILKQRKNLVHSFWYWRVEREGFLQCGGHFGQVEKYINAWIIHNIFPRQMDSSHFINIAWNRTGPRRLTLTKSIIDNSRRRSGSVGCFYPRMIIVIDVVLVAHGLVLVLCCFFGCAFGAFGKKWFFG